MITRSKAELFLLGEPVSVLKGANYHNYIIMHYGLFHDLQLRQSFAVTITKIANDCLKIAFQ